MFTNDVTINKATLLQTYFHSMYLNVPVHAVFSIITSLSLFYMTNIKCRALMKTTLGPTHPAC